MVKKEIEEVTFSKKTLMTSSLYRHQSDVLAVILEDNKVYTLADVDKRINNFMKGKVS